MMVKKTVMEGAELTQVFTSPLALLHDYFQTKPVEAKTVRWGTQDYRKYKEALKSKKEKWQEVSTGAEKQAVFEKHMKNRYSGGI
jgi:hypothetical protein